MPEVAHLLRGLGPFLACADVAGGDDKNPALQLLPASVQEQAAAALAQAPEVGFLRCTLFRAIHPLALVCWFCVVPDRIAIKFHLAPHGMDPMDALAVL